MKSRHNGHQEERLTALEPGTSGLVHRHGSHPLDGKAVEWLEEVVVPVSHGEVVVPSGNARDQFLPVVSR